MGAAGEARLLSTATCDAIAVSRAPRRQASSLPPEPGSSPLFSPKWLVNFILHVAAGKSDIAEYSLIKPSELKSRFCARAIHATPHARRSESRAARAEMPAAVSPVASDPHSRTCPRQLGLRPRSPGATNSDRSIKRLCYPIFFEDRIHISSPP